MMVSRPHRNAKKKKKDEIYYREAEEAKEARLRLHSGWVLSMPHFIYPLITAVACGQPATTQTSTHSALATQHILLFL